MPPQPRGATEASSAGQGAAAGRGASSLRAAAATWTFFEGTSEGGPTPHSVTPREEDAAAAAAAAAEPKAQRPSSSRGDHQPLPRTQSEDAPVECFFMTELEPSEPGAEDCEPSPVSIPVHSAESTEKGMAEASGRLPWCGASDYEDEEFEASVRLPYCGAPDYEGEEFEASGRLPCSGAPDYEGEESEVGEQAANAEEAVAEDSPWESPIEVGMVDFELQASRSVSRCSQRTTSPPGTPYLIKGLRHQQRQRQREEEEEPFPDAPRRAARTVTRVTEVSEAEFQSAVETHPAPVTAAHSTSSSAGPQATVRLEVTIDHAMFLRNADWLSLSDPYCILDVHGNEPQSFQTKVIRDNLDPVWEETCEINYTFPEPLFFRIFDKDFGKRDDFLGEATLTPDHFWDAGFDGRVALSNSGNPPGQEAQLYLKVRRVPTPA